MRKADLPLGGRCLLTCRLLHHADKSESRRRDECGDGPHACPGGEVRWCSEMVNKRLRRVNLASRKVGVLREGGQLIRRDLTAAQRAKPAARRAYEAVRPETKHSGDWGGTRERDEA